MIFRRTNALPLLLAIAPGCTLIEPPDGGPQVGSAPAVVAGEAAAVDTNVSSDAEEAVAEPARLLSSEDLFGAQVVDADGEELGVLVDFLVEPGAGRLVGVSVDLKGDSDDAEPRSFDYDRVSWAADESGAPRLTLAVTRSELDAELERDATFVNLFDGQESQRVTGQVRSVERSGRGALIVKLHDEENLLHRVLLEPSYLVIDPDAPIVEGSRLSAAGVETRDTTGKLLVARSMEREDREVELRDEAGAVRWNALAQRYRSARELAAHPLVAADDTALTSTSLFVDWDRGVIEFIGVDVDGVEYGLPWSAVDRTSDVARVSFDSRELAMLPIVTGDGQVADQL